MLPAGVWRILDVRPLRADRRRMDGRDHSLCGGDNEHGHASAEGLYGIKEKGERDGIVKGIAEGMERGKSAGRTDGRAEGNYQSVDATLEAMREICIDDETRRPVEDLIARRALRNGGLQPANGADRAVSR